VLRPAEWFAPPSTKVVHLAPPTPTPAAKVLRLPVVAPPLPCTSCDERAQPGAERKRLSQQLRLLKRNDFERPLRGACAMPCSVLEARLNPDNPCQGCFHREAKTCKSACHVLEKLLPRATPTYYDEVPVRDAVLEIRAPEVEEPDPLDRRWRWADVADAVRPDFQRTIEERLTEKQRRAILMHLDGMSGVAIAKAMGVCKVTAFWHKKRAMRHLVKFFRNSPDARRRAEAAMSRTAHDGEVD
jgi:hypothetical protein